MAFGISCSLPLRMAEPPRTGLTPSPSPPEMPKALRCSPKRYLPTLASCGLSDNVFYGKQKWPREKSFNISLGSNGTRCSNQDSGGRRLPEVVLERPTRHGLSHTRYSNFVDFEQTKKEDRELKAKLKQLQFPVLELLQSTKFESLKQESKRTTSTAPAQLSSTTRRYVAMPKSFRTRIFVDARGRHLFSEQALM